MPPQIRYRFSSQQHGQSILCKDHALCYIPHRAVRAEQGNSYSIVAGASDLNYPVTMISTGLTRGSYRPKKPAGNWFLDEVKSGGILMDLMIHDYDYARWIAGEVESVSARRVTELRVEPVAGRVWTYSDGSGGARSLKAIDVHTGISDGTWAELLDGSDLPEGRVLVSNVDTGRPNVVRPSTSPLMPGRPGGDHGGGHGGPH